MILLAQLAPVHTDIELMAIAKFPYLNPIGKFMTLERQIANFFR